MENNGLLYIAICSITNKSYIGQTTQGIEFRKIEHLSRSKRGENYKFYNAIRKYGWDSFRWEILKDNIPKEKLDIEEILAIKMYNTYVDGYNCTFGGSALSMTKEIKEKISTTQKNRLSKMKHPMLGKHHSLETKRKISLANTGKKRSEECKKRQSFIGKKIDRHGEKNPNSKMYKVIKPDNSIEIIKCLSQYCKDNNLTRRSMNYVLSGKHKHHKQYRCERL